MTLGVDKLYWSRTDIIRICGRVLRILDHTALVHLETLSTLFVYVSARATHSIVVVNIGEGGRKIAV